MHIFLCLEGYDDIVRMQGQLEQDGRMKHKLQVLPLHSSCSAKEQQLVFKHPPPVRTL